MEKKNRQTGKLQNPGKLHIVFLCMYLNNVFDLKNKRWQYLTMTVQNTY